FGDVIDIDATQAAAIGVAVMLVTGVLTWKDALAERAAWDTMVWIGILIMLAAKLNESGLIAWFGKALPLPAGLPPPPLVPAGGRGLLLLALPLRERHRAHRRAVPDRARPVHHGRRGAVPRRRRPGVPE